MVGHYSKQRVVALNFWTGDTPSWEENTNADGNIEVSYRPPFYEGASLGGFGLRAMFAGGAVCFDVGFSDETTSAWVMFGHPF